MEQFEIKVFREEKEQKKKYKKILKPEEPVRIMPEIWCHQCKMKKTQLVCCDNFFKKQKTDRCNGKYCESCVKRHYGTTIEELSEKKQWQCFKCQRNCLCANCKRERGEQVMRKKKQEIIWEPILFFFFLKGEDIPIKKRRRRKRSEKESDGFNFSGQNFTSSLPHIPVPRILEESKRHKTRPSLPDIKSPVFLSPFSKITEFEVLAEAATSLIGSTEERVSSEEKIGTTHCSMSISNLLVSDDVECDKCSNQVKALKNQLSFLKSEIKMLHAQIGSKSSVKLLLPSVLPPPTQVPVPTLRSFTPPPVLCTKASTLPSSLENSISDFPEGLKFASLVCNPIQIKSPAFTTERSLEKPSTRILPYEEQQKWRRKNLLLFSSF